MRVAVEPPAGPSEQADDTLLLLTRCCHPDLSEASAIALTLRAVAGLSTAQIARAYLVPEATMAQRISRAKPTLRDARFDQVGHAGAVLRVLYLMFDHGFTGPVDVAEGVQILQGALAQDRLGEYQARAAIAALHDDAPRAEETDWPQVLSWYDELVRLVPGHPVIAMNRAVAVAQVDGPRAGLKALTKVPDGVPRRTAVAAWLHERAGEHARASELYAQAADAASSEAERAHLLKRAALSRR